MIKAKPEPKRNAARANVTDGAVAIVTRDAFAAANDAILAPQVVALKALIKKRGGRVRQHATDAARQKAYRERKRTQIKEDA